MELHDPLHPGRPRREESGPEVQRVFFLAKPGARNDADSSSFEETHAVELVCGALLGGGGFDGLRGKGYCGEEIHGALGVGLLDG